MKFSAITNNVLNALFTAKTNAIWLGRPGMGKTERIKQYAEESGIGFVSFALTSVDAPDVRGFAVPTKDEKGRAVTKFTLSPLLDEIERDGHKQGILFLDEVLQSEHIVQKAVAPVFDQRKLGEHSIPDGWVVWGASNRLSDKAGVNTMLGHFSNRVAQLEIEPDVDGWVAWANDNGVHPMYVAFAKARPGIVFDAEPPKTPSAPFCSPRSLTYSQNYHRAISGGGMKLADDPVTQFIISGHIGEGAAAEFFSFIKVVNTLPTIEEIMNDPVNAKTPPPERMDAAFAAVQMLVHYADGNNIDTLFKYAERLNKELQVSCAQQLVAKSGGTLLNSQALTQWMSQNSALIAATTAL